jgi:hypothetical protein
MSGLCSELGYEIMLMIDDDDDTVCVHMSLFILRDISPKMEIFLLPISSRRRRFSIELYSQSPKS